MSVWLNAKGNLISWQSVPFAPPERRAATREAAVSYNGVAQRSSFRPSSPIRHRCTHPADNAGTQERQTLVGEVLGIVFGKKMATRVASPLV